MVNILKVIIKEDNSIEVIDEGRGMPYKTHSSGRPTTEVLLTKLHSGGKFSEEAGYKVSGGLHGVGSAVVNALSQFLVITIQRDGYIFRQKFSEGGSVIGPLEKIGETKKTGTSIWFKPDPSIFSTTLYQFDQIKERLREAAFLLKGLSIELVDERNKTVKETFHYEDGIKAYVSFLNENKKIVTDVELMNGVYQTVNGKKGLIDVDVAFQFTQEFSEQIISFVNNVRTKDGGTHEIGFKIALTKIVNDYARKYNILKDKDSNLDGSDIREGLTAIVSLRITENLLEFEGQTKSKLGTPEARTALDFVLSDKLTAYLEENKTVAETIIARALQAQRVREAARKAREEARAGKIRNKKEVSLSGKLSPAQSKDKTINELFFSGRRFSRWFC